MGVAKGRGGELGCHSQWNSKRLTLQSNGKTSSLQRSLVLVVGGCDGGLHFLREARVKVLHVVGAVERRAVGRPQLPQLQLHSFFHSFRVGWDRIVLALGVSH